MTFYELAFRYLKGKKAKAILLFFVLFFVCSMILSTNMILRASKDSRAAIQEKADAKIIADILKEDNRITLKEAEEIEDMDETVSVNRLSENFAVPVDFSPIAGPIAGGGPEEEHKVKLLSYDSLEKDSAFYEGRYRLISGDYIGGGTEGIVMNSILAEANGLKVGDKVEIDSQDGKVSVQIAGLFLAGSERKQTDTILGEDRIENQIFIDNVSYEKLFPEDGFYKIAVYCKDPKRLGTLEKKVEAVLGEKAELTASDTLYKQMQLPLEQIIQVTSLMLGLTLMTGTAVVSLLLCMWMRTRRKEMAVFISLGKDKKGIFLQVFLESFLVFGLAAAGSCCFGGFMSGVLEAVLTQAEGAGTAGAIFLQMEDIAKLAGMGGIVVMAAVTVSLFPVLRADPKDTLSKMEG